MKLLTRSIIASACLGLAACSQPAETPLNGAWTVDGAESHFSFVTVKAGAIAEAHSFGSVTGSVSADGAAQIDIDLDTVETNIDIRNERMREFLFETDSFPTATVTAQLDPSVFAQLGVGESVTQPVTATLNLHGVENDVDAELSVTRIGPDKVLVATTEPIIINADSFDLGDGVEKLRELAGLPGITPQVPVAFSLVFTR
ncbi:YceI family protein [Hyphococcus luteus]|uniref:YceI family protein n=1 Tax=Hyphococcus luteus TaxID=2058213 RepID=A0A2S7JZJ8_9PROT|nr:YceI family protein [Marinicaulis flavus]PQA85675.1 YceI family protein [Marinicaulis flavus]